MPKASMHWPAEWAPQQATLLAWPAAHTDWGKQGTTPLSDVQAEYRALIRTITQHQPVLLLIPPKSAGEDWHALASHHPVLTLALEYNDTWCRDYGPIIVFNGDRRVALDFNFNGWGDKFDAQLDNAVTAKALQHPLLTDLSLISHPLVLEGGAIESNGEGCLLLNWHCLRQRQPDWSQDQWSARLGECLPVDHIIGIDLSPMAGDDTDGHIDTLVRFIAADHVAVQTQADPTRDAQLMTQLHALRLGDGRALRITRLPIARDLPTELPASYANFLFINGACLIPAFGSPADGSALRQLQAALPDRVVKAVPSATLITQSGSVHCASMQLPQAPVRSQ